MKVTKLNDGQAVANYVADSLLALVNAKPQALLMLATGETPTLTYDEVARRLQQKNQKWNKVKIHKLDEWLGLGINDKASCEHYLHEHVLTPWGIERDNYTGVDATSSDIAAECARNSDYLHSSGGADVCVLGLGVNGHIGFNEPAAELFPYTSLIALEKTSQNHSMVAGLPNITHGVTTGIVEIMQSKKIILVVTGAKKKHILQQLSAAKITTQLPASLLLMHPNLEIIADAEAGSLLG